MPPIMQVRLLGGKDAWTPSTSGILPFESLSWANPLNDVPTLTVKIPRKLLETGGEFDRFDAVHSLMDADMVVQVNFGDGWTEPANARFVPLQENANLMDPTRSTDYSCQGVCWDMSAWPLITGDCRLEKYEFTNVRVGQIITAYFERKMGSLTTKVTNTYDSTQKFSWPDIITLETNRKVTLLQTLVSLTEQGLVEWRTQGNELQVYSPSPNPDTPMHRNRTNVALLLGREIVDAPIVTNNSALLGALIIYGEAGYLNSASNPKFYHYRGWRYAAQTQTGIRNIETAGIFASNILDKVGVTRQQYTFAISVTQDSQFLPYRDYNVGDLVMAPGASGKLEAMRIHQITLTVESDGVVKGSVILHDRLLDKANSDAKKIAQAIGFNGGTSASYI